MLDKDIRNELLIIRADLANLLEYLERRVYRGDGEAPGEIVTALLKAYELKILVANSLC